MRKQELHPRTEIINKKQKNQARSARYEALLWLATTFPAAFNNSELIRPLKLGIMNDILSHAENALEVGLSRSKLREAVVVFTRRIDYLTCLKAREMRIDLEGNPVSPVSEEEASHAAMKIKKRVEKSTRNARKEAKPASHHSTKSADKISPPSEHQRTPYYPEYPPAFSAQNSLQPARTSSVLVKHKSSRAYDPDAVARMKERLGLSRPREVKETS
ncbi:MAG: ProQ/FinO family protein [Legionellales bacterium]|nr:ProQ/FinO family protein [Legionellales bacterium]